VQLTAGKPPISIYRKLKVTGDKAQVETDYKILEKRRNKLELGTKIQVL